jgi:D-lactate dehydrogenase
LTQLLGTADITHGTQYADLRVLDAIDFVLHHVLPKLSIRRRLPSLALHPTCSSTRLGTNDALLELAGAIADNVVVPDTWNCCGFAGDRGLLHPELTAAATRPQAATLAHREFTAYASCNRTCEIGMTRATGAPYRHLIEIIEENTR